MKLSRNSKHIEVIPPMSPRSMQGAGIKHNSKHYVTHTTLHHSFTALKTFSNKQKLFLFLLLATTIISFIWQPLSTLKIAVALMSVLYFADILFNTFIIGRSIKNPPEIKIPDHVLRNLNDLNLPVYTILCPLYKEAHVLPQFVESINKLDWPKEKLDVQLLLEEDDEETVLTANQMNLPDYFRIIVVPHSAPKTKPKACNFGLAQARGEFLVIYDAEDRPEPLQLKKAYSAFLSLPQSVKCLQAKLNYFNPQQNLLTRLFTIEYSLWFDVMLPGYQHVGTVIPLGGTSNHFRTADLNSFLGWDPFNVTEDCDLGVRLFKQGYRTAIIDSITYEEANSNLANWIRQRSRWIKGYMQTFLVHMRQPYAFLREHNMHAIYFQLIVGGKIAFMLINPIMWILTISYFTLYAYVGSAIESLFPGIVFGMAFTSLIIGNFLFMYAYMIGVAKRNAWQLMRYVYLQPLYWLAVSYAAVMALYQLIVKPHYWEKTIHGLDQKLHARPKLSPSPSMVYASSIFGAYGLNFAYNWYLSNSLPSEIWGSLSYIGAILAIAQLIFVPLTRCVSYVISKNQDKVDWQKFAYKNVFVGIVVGSIWLLATPIITSQFDIEPFYSYSLVPILIVGFLYSVDAGYISGRQLFGPLAWIVVVEAMIKLILAVGLNTWFGNYLVILALPISVIFAFLAQRLLIGTFQVKRNDFTFKFPNKYFWSSLISRVSAVGFVTLDLIFAKYYLSNYDVSNYATLSLIGKIIFLTGTFANGIITPQASANAVERKNAKQFVYLSMLATLAISAILIYYPQLLRLVFGSKFNNVISVAVPYLVGMTAYTLTLPLITYAQARNKHWYSYLSLVTLSLQIGLYWFWHQDITSFIRVIWLTGIAHFGLIASFYLLQWQLINLRAFIFDFTALFSRYTNSPLPESLRILVINWRDSKHKWAGGAETYIQETAKEWVRAGHKVTLFCGNDEYLPANENCNGINIVRRGGLYTVYLWAFLYYLVQFRGKFDIIVDCENGIPFFTPLYSRIPKYLLIFHIHQNIFHEHLSAPFTYIARFLEAKLMPYVYRKEQVVTISPSTHDEVVSLGITERRKLHIIEPGLQAKYFQSRRKTENPSFVYVGRLKKYKNVDIAIRAFVDVLKTNPSAKLTIAGSGDARHELEHLAKVLGLREKIEFAGHVSEKYKRELMATSWAAIQPSSYEGWGLTVIEANAAGTPVIASNVPGLKDTIVPNVTGILVKRRDVQALSGAMLTLINDKSKREMLGSAAQEWAKRFRWENTANKFIQTVYKDQLNYRKVPVYA